MNPRALHPTRLLGLAVGIGLAAIALGSFLSLATADEWFEDLWFEVAKAGVQVVAVGVVVGGLAAFWRYLNDESARQHDIEHRRQEHLESDYAKLVSLYNEVKAIRRRLSSLGLDLQQRHSQHPHPSNGRLTTEQASGFHTELLLLNDAQLGFEDILRGTRVSDLLGDCRGPVIEELDKIQSYLNSIVSGWERRASGVVVDAELAPVSELLQPLFRKNCFRPGISDRFDRITKAYNTSLFGTGPA